jgi:hypothetical protein
MQHSEYPNDVTLVQILDRLEASLMALRRAHRGADPPARDPVLEDALEAVSLYIADVEAAAQVVETLAADVDPDDDPPLGPGFERDALAALDAPVRRPKGGAA